MKHPLYLTNSLTRKKEQFIPVNPPFTGLYVCGPTVYGEAHLGHARPYITFDVLCRYLRFLGYKVRYVRNITDVGHLENDADQGEDKIAKKARLEQLEPMEVVELYTNSFHESMRLLNNEPPSIEPRASGHIIEQIEMIGTIIDNGYAYESNGSVYFDVIRYSKDHDYGRLSGRVIDELIAGAGNERRELEGQDEKRNPADFALWKKATPSHIMRWPSPWSEGFPGWHIECSAMSRKYLGETFDIHGGGMDLLFPHHESEIAQSKGCCGQAPVRFWMHNNMITINGRKMGKSYNNVIKLTELFSGQHPILAKAFHPMTIRFFILQTHYSSTLDFSNEALLAAEKGLKRLMDAVEGFYKVDPTAVGAKENSADPSLEAKVNEWLSQLPVLMNDDFSTARVLATIFELVPVLNSIKDGITPAGALSAATITQMQSTLRLWLETILGLKSVQAADQEKLQGVMELLIDIRKEAKGKRDFMTSDKIRDRLAALGIQLKDEKGGGMSWTLD